MVFKKGALGKLGVEFEVKEMPTREGLVEELLNWQIEEIRNAPTSVADGYLATERKLIELGPEGEQHLAKGIYLLCQWIREQEKERIREERGADQSAIADPVSRGKRLQERGRRRNEGRSQGDGGSRSQGRNRSRNRKRNRSR